MREKLFAWLVTAFAAAALVALVVIDESPQPDIPQPSVPDFLFWLSILLAAQLLPVTLGFGTQVTMAYPILVAVAILFPPSLAMVTAGLGSVDPREFKREIPLNRALFNRAQWMLALGAAAAIVSLAGGAFRFPEGLLTISGAAFSIQLISVGLVGIGVHIERELPLSQALENMIPRPIGGFILMQGVLAGLGAATAAVFLEFGAVVAAIILIPLMFARLSILGAHAQQELSERVRRQQQALLEATEQVFQERENERHRIAEEIHDGSLQLLAAASYGIGNAQEFMAVERDEQATDAMEAAREALNDAIKMLRGSLVDLRRSTVEEGGLLETIHRFADQVSVLWGTEVGIEGTIKNEPPIPVALAAFQILQEGLTNALKHAHGSDVTVTIGDEDGMVHIIVEDKGPGFDPDAEVGADHVGMRLMKDRAARVGGRIELASTPGAGTRLEAILPGGVAQ
ncbi:MAG TPA: sensor histidine kinase [Actinomycetota bacterium]|jgi:signal transduction histidine kinase|nr:sensor histidine kinase [Actinomycetota bacterium]